MGTRIVLLVLVFLADAVLAGAEPAPGEFMKDWLILKPVSARGSDDMLARDWLATEGGEPRIQPKAGDKAGRLKWEQIKLDCGVADLLVNGHPVNHAVAYAFREFVMPEAKGGWLGIGSDDEVKVWLNGKVVDEFLRARSLHTDDDLVAVDFQPGTNRLLLKIENETGPWGFACRILDQEQAAGLKLAHENRSNPASAPLTDDAIKTLLREEIVNDKLGAGLVVGIAEGSGARVMGEGNLDNGTGDRVDGDTIFEVGSITKVFTVVLLQDMVERGQMKLDDPVQKYLPASIRVPTFHGKPITLLHLATHTSGLPRHRGEVHPANWRNPEAGYSVEQLAAGLARFRLARAPGTQYQYSNVGMEILGYAIALKAGKDYETLVRDRICRPLGMESTFVSVPPELRPRMARGHAMPGRPVPDMDFSPLCASAGLRSTANDLLKFVSACAGLTPSPLEPLLEKPEAPHALKSGAKVPLAWQSDGNFFQHSGMTYGFTANVAFDRNRRRAVVMLANCNSSLGFIQGRLGRAISAGRSPEPARTVSLAPAMLNQYAGLYRTDGGATYTVRREGAGLMVRPLNEPGERFRDDGFGVFPQSASVLYNKLWDVDAVFSRAAGGAAPRMTVAWPKFTLEAVRVSNDIPPTPDPIQVDPSIYDSFAGRYRHMLFCGLVPVGPTLIIRREDDELGAHLMAYMRCKYIAALARNQDSNDLGGTDMTGLELFPDTKTAYGPAVTLANLRLEFALNKQGKTTGLTVEANGKTFTAKRVSAKPVAWK